MTGVARVTSQLVQIAAFLAGARMLGPAEFGAYAVVSAGAILAARAAQGGWNGHILSTRGGEAAVRQTLLLAILAGLAVGAATFGLTRLELGPLRTPEVRALLTGFAVWIVLSAWSDAQGAVLVREGRVAAAALCQMGGELAGLAVTLALLAAGAGVVALVWGRLAAQAVQLLAMLALVPLPPAPWPSLALVRHALDYSGNILLVRVVGTFRGSVGTLMVGGFLGAEAAGLFRLAQRLTSAIYEVLCEPARTAAWVALRQSVAEFDAPADPRLVPALQAGLERLVPVLLALAAPAFLGVALLGGDLLALLLGEAWRAAGPVAAILAIGNLLVVPTSLAEPVWALAGRIGILTRMTLAFTAIHVLAVLAGGPFGLHGIALAHVAAGVAGLVLAAVVQERTLGLRWRPIARTCLVLLLPLAALALALLGMRGLAVRLDAGPLAAMLLILPAALGAYAGTLLLLRGHWLIARLRRPRQP